MTAALIDDPSRGLPDDTCGWALVTDGVMGGLSQGTLRRETVRGRAAIRLRGEVSLANNGGFLQLARDLAAGGAAVDASSFQGIEVEVAGNAELYAMHLRTTAVTRPWQSWRQDFHAGPDWAVVRLPFAEFRPHRIELAFDPAQLRRIGLVAIGRAFQADLSVGRVRFYR